MIFILFFVALLCLDYFLEKKGFNIINFFKIYGFAVLILMIFSLSTNKIFKNNNLIFKNQIKTETNNLIKKKVFFIVF